MKKLIQETNNIPTSNYQLWAEVTSIPHMPGTIELKFESVWTGAKDPEAPQTKARFILDANAVATLKDLLSSS